MLLRYGPRAAPPTTTIGSIHASYGHDFASRTA